MKKLIRGIIWLLLFVALLLITGLFLPRYTTAESSVQINAPRRIVFAQVNDLRSWDKWSVWHQDIRGETVDFEGNGVGEGGGYLWKDEPGDTIQNVVQIEKSVPYDSIIVSVYVSRYDPALGTFSFDTSDSITLVVWKMIFDAGNNPVERWLGLLSGFLAKPEMEQSLEYLEIVSEVQTQENSLIPELIVLEEFIYAGVRDQVPFMEVGLRMGEMYGTVTSYIESAGVGIAGVPFAIYHQIREEVIDLECGVPISDTVQGNAPVIIDNFPRTRCVAVDYYGDYQALEDAHTAVQAWIDERNFKLAGPPMEFYMTDAATDQNPESWLTRICYPVE